MARQPPCNDRNLWFRGAPVYIHMPITLKPYNPGMLETAVLETNRESRKRELQDDPRWKLIERILASTQFSKSARLCSFLQFVAEETLAGRGEQLNEQRIGVRVFGRRVDYDSAEDNIVRSHASRLRQRLEAYFFVEGQSETLRVSLPRGAYVLQFEEQPSVVPEATGPAIREITEAVKAADVAKRLPSNNKGYRIAWILGVAFLIAVFFALYNWHRYRSAVQAQTSASPVIHALWSEVFPVGQRTLIIPADSTLVLYENIMGKRVDLHTYMNKSYMDGDPVFPEQSIRETANMVAHRRLTSVADLEMTARMLQVPEAIANGPQIRFARDIQVADLKESNAIIIGAATSDPWLSVFDSKMNFTIVDEMVPTLMNARVINRSPRPGEQSAYMTNRNDPGHKAYAVIALMPNSSGHGMVLVVEGTVIAGTEAASEFITDPQQIEAVLGPMFKQYGKIPPFEILLETTDLNGSAPQSHVLATRVNP